jgi:hypothetical protein
MKRLFSLATTLSLALVFASARAAWSQGQETVGSLATKGFEVRGVALVKAVYPYIVMQKGSAVYYCTAIDIDPPEKDIYPCKQLK